MEAKRNTMLGVSAKVWVTLCLGYITVFAAQLPPEMLVDKFLLQAKMLSEEKKHKGALEAMDRIVVLQKAHDLTLPGDFPFHYAQTALAAGAVQAAIDSANRYLSVAGREGKYYRQALELLVKAERRLQEPAADRVGSTPVKPDHEPQPQAVLPASTQTQKTTAAQPMVDCRKWNTKKFFRKATVEDVTACVTAGADLDARDGGFWSDCSKCTPLHRAVMHNENVEVVQALIDASANLEAGANLEARHQFGNTPLHTAVLYNENVEVVKALLKGGADPNARGTWKYTPLHQAAVYNENPAVIKALIDAGAALDVQTRDSESTPLHKAAESNDNPEVVKALIDAGAALTAWDEKGKTPLKVARRRHRKVLRNAWARLPESQKATARARRKSQSDGGALAALVAGVAGGAIASASGLDAATATEIGATIGGSVLVDEAVGSSGTGAASGGTSGNTGATAGGGPCQVPGYPNPPGGVSNLGFSWCPASVSLQVRSFALQAAGAQCAIATGSSSTPEQIEARRREIQAACDRLAALGQGNCQCPPGLK